MLKNESQKIARELEHQPPPPPRELPGPLSGPRGYFHVCIYIYIVYVPLERPPFLALNFRSGAYHFHKCSNTSLRSGGASPFYSLCRFGDHNFRNFAAYGRLTLLRSPALSHPSHSSSLRSLAFFTLPRRCGVSGRPKCPPDASYSPFRRPAFSRSTSPSSLPGAPLRSPAFLRSIRSPHCSPCRGKYLPKFGVSTPPPPWKRALDPCRKGLRTSRS